MLGVPFLEVAEGKMSLQTRKTAVVGTAVTLLVGLFLLERYLHGPDVTIASYTQAFRRGGKILFDAAELEILRKDQEAMFSQFRSLRMMIGQLYCKVEKIGPTGGFCLTKDEARVGGNDIIDVDVAQILAETFKNSSVLDLGCGLGHYGKWFKANAPTVNWQGYDGAENVEEATNGAVKFADLTAELRLPLVDWVMSVEVGEHIPKQYMDIFIDNICKLAKVGVVISWARPGQGGHNHVNLLPYEEVQALFVKRGLVPDIDLGLRLRNSARVDWLKHTMQAFEVPQTRNV